MTHSKQHITITLSDDYIRRLTADGYWGKFRYLSSLRQRKLDGLELDSFDVHDLEMAEVVYGPDWWQVYPGYQRLQWREAAARRRARLRAEAAD